MAHSKKQAIPTEENVDLLNQEDKVSETPATLVAPSPDHSYEANSEDGSKLSPNPAGSGFTSQRLVDSLPQTGLVNVLYIVPIKNAGENIIGYKKWSWDLETRSWKRVFGSIPSLSLADGGREQRAIVTNPNRDKPKVFNERVVFNGEVYIGGRKVTGEDKEGTYVEGNPTDDGETHEELVRIQIGDEQFDIPTQQGDEDIISQITKEYMEADDITNIDFPTGIMPLNITINNHELFFKQLSLVDSNGDIVEGYESDDLFILNGKVRLVVVGDITEQVINSLIYVKFNKEPADVISDSLILFNPSAYISGGGGTKLYKHVLTIPGSALKYIEYINTDPTPLSFTSFETVRDAILGGISPLVKDVNNVLLPIVCIRYDNQTNSIDVDCAYISQNITQNIAFTYQPTIWSVLANSTDTVTEL